VGNGTPSPGLQDGSASAIPPGDENVTADSPSGLTNAPQSLEQDLSRWLDSPRPQDAVPNSTQPIHQFETPRITSTTPLYDAASTFPAEAQTGTTPSPLWEQATQPIQQMLGPTMAAPLNGSSGAGQYLSSLLGPLAEGLLSLFENSDNSTPATGAVEKFALPPKLNYELGYSESNGSGLFPIDYTAEGSPRPQPAAAANAGQQVIVQVQAMDSQSIIDRRHEIADAVRLALLESHSLNDQLTYSE
jgi:hypothetical protein